MNPLASVKGNEMRRIKDASKLSKKAALLLLAVSLCAGASLSGSAAAHSAKGKRQDSATGGRNKVSSDLRDKVRDSKDDRRRQSAGGTTSVIVQVSGQPSGQLKAFLNRQGVHVNAQFKNLNAFAAELPVSAIEELASFAEVSYVSADREMVSLGGNLSTLTGAEAVRQQTTAAGTSYTLDGTGVGIAVLDSGIYNAHKSFAGHYGGGKDYTGEARTDDPHGHGTHVASIAAGGSDAVKGKYVGIAPNATIYNLRVLNSFGVGRVSSVL